MKRKILIVGAGDPGKLALQSINNEPNLGYDVAGFIDDTGLNGKNIEGIKIHKNIDKLERYIRRCGIHDILFADFSIEKKKLMNIINSIQHKAENILYMPELSGVAVLGAELRHFFNEQSFIIEIKNNLAKPINYLIKRVFDFCAGLFLFILFILPILLISVLIKLTSRGPAIFKQERIGKDGNLFMCFKFRTMHEEADKRLKEILDNDHDAKFEYERFWKLKNDPRITQIGKLLRRTSLDELPQIINVIKGEMSLVGPRPYLPGERDFLSEHGEVILSVPPGITGLWQTFGRSNKTYEERISLDTWYVRNWNLWLDLIILIKTVRVVFRKEGAL